MAPSELPVPDLSVVIPCHREVENLRHLLPDLQATLAETNLDYEIILVDSDSKDGTQELAAALEQVQYHLEPAPGYGNALRKGFEVARADYILTLDADLSHPAAFLQALWEARTHDGITIASRYVPGGYADQNWFRLQLSRLLNGFFRWGFSLPYRDMSSGYRLYHRTVFQRVRPGFDNFVILLEILLQAHAEGLPIREIPFHYQPRHTGQSSARIIAFGLDYLRLFFHLRILRKARKQTPDA